MGQSPGKKEKIESISQELIEMTDKFCDEYLNDEYKTLSRNLILKMKRKHQVPFLSGWTESWAAGVIYALGQINFLSDQSFEPYVEKSVIPDHFGISQSTASQKAKTIRDMFDLGYFDPEFSTSRTRESNPLNEMVMIDRLVVPADTVPDSPPNDENPQTEGEEKR